MGPYESLCFYVEQNRLKVSNRLAALDDLDSEVEINSAWKVIRENIKISAKENLGYFELKKHKPLLDKGCSKVIRLTETS
jgi:phosphomevalonate kinase